MEKKSSKSSITYKSNLTQIKENFQVFLKNKVKPVKITEFRNNKISEEQTKDYLIKPFFSALGWDFSNDEEIIPQDDDSTGKKPDYGFYQTGNRDKPYFYLETKAIANKLDDHKMIGEKMGYCNTNDIPFLVLTNGVLYKVLYNELKGQAWEKILFELALDGEYNEDQVLLLSREKIENDELAKYAKEAFVSSYIYQAIINLFNACPEELNKLLNQQLRTLLGHTFGASEIETKIKHFGQALQVQKTLLGDSLSLLSVKKIATEFEEAVREETDEAGQTRTPRYSSFTFQEVTYPFTSFVEMYAKIASIIAKDKPAEFRNKVLSMGTDYQPIFSENLEDVLIEGHGKPRQVEGTSIYMYVNYNAKEMLKKIYNLLDAFGYPPDSLNLNN